MSILEKKNDTMPRIYSVSEFVEHINALVATEVFVVEGEVSGFNLSQGRWVFFDLKDEKNEAKVGCFMMAFRLKVPVENGMKIRVVGTPRVHEKSGQFRITVEAVELVGEGALRRAYELLKKKLASEGLFAPERKRPLPRFPDVVGVVASRESAAYGDFMRIGRNRWAGSTILLAHVQVQGARATPDVVGALNALQSPSPESRIPSPDVIVLIRGGGSLEDLQAFNSEDVARAIFNSRIPVVVGVGHERDETIADYVADVRASTPSNAAELIFPDRNEIEYALDSMNHSMGSRLRQGIASYASDVEHAISRLDAFFRDQTRHARELETRLLATATNWTRRFTDQLASTERLLKSLDPRAVLRRGYSITFAPDGSVLRVTADAPPGSEIRTALAGGQLKSRVVGSQTSLFE